MADGSVVIKVGADTGSASKSIQLLKAQIEKLGQTDAGKKLSSALEQAGWKSEELTKGFNRLGSVGTKAMAGLSSAVKVGAASAAAGAVALTTAIAGVGKQALDSYAKYEQMVGGIDKLFGAGPAQSVEEYAQQVGKSVDKVRGEYDKLNKASKLVQKNAQEAFKTAGMSANDYMESVTGISASLINSLGGDTEKAAKMADVAMRGISDNANTFGTDAESLVQTYQSLARGQYAMLDNLKLGYGGTKQELARLVDDANKYAATHKKAAAEIGVNNKLSADSYADVVAAIELVQQKQGISGTTAREAATTIEGSVSMAKAAWQNFVTELGKDDADMGARTDELVESVVTAASNVIPRIGEIMANLGSAIADELPEIGEMVSSAMEDVDLEGGLEKLLTGGADLATSVIETIQETDWASVGESLMTSIGDAVGSVDWGAVLSTGNASISTAITGVIEGAASYISENGGDILESVLGVILQIAGAIVSSIPQYLTAIGSLLNAIIDAVLGLLGNLATQAATAAGEVASGIIDGIYNGLRGLADSIGEQVQAAVDSVKSFAGAMLSSGKELASNIGKGISNAKAKVISAAKGAVNKAKEGLSGIVSKFGEVGKNIIDGIKNGITDTASRIADAAREAAEGALNAAKNFLGIHSPSRKFRDEVGVQITEGMALGIKKGTGKVAKQAKKTSELTVSAFSKQLRKLEKQYGKSTAMTAAFWKKAGDKAKDGSKVQAKCYAKMEKAAEKYAASLNLGDQLSYYEKHAKALKKIETAQKKAVKQTKSGTAANKQASASLKQTQKDLEDNKKSLKDVKKAIKEAAAQAKDDFIGVEQVSNKSLLQIKEDLDSTLKDIQDNLKQTIDNTKETLRNGFGGLFDEFKFDEAPSMDTILGNFGTKVTGLKEYTQQIDELGKKLSGLGADGLLNQIKELGPSALGYIETLNGSSSEQLGELVEMWKEYEKGLGETAKDLNKDAIEAAKAATEAAKKLADDEAKAALKAYKTALAGLGKKYKKTSKEAKKYAETLEELAGKEDGAKKAIDGLAESYDAVIGEKAIAIAEQYKSSTTSALEAAAKATEDSVKKQETTVKQGTTLITQTVKTAMDSQYSAVSGTMSAMESKVSATVASIASMMQQISSFEAAANAQHSATAATLASAKAKASSAKSSGKSSGAKAHAEIATPAAKAVNWYAAGGIFNSPQVIGIGEQGTEFALRDYHLDGIAERMGKAQQADISAAIGTLIRVLPGIIKSSTPDSISVNKREFGRLVREV